jgi:hypothetical protein
MCLTLIVIRGLLFFAAAFSGASANGQAFGNRGWLLQFVTARVLHGRFAAAG